jgi:hypothetical protein
VTKDKAQNRSPGSLTKYVVYAVALPVMYLAMTPKITGNFTENEARGFRIAAVKSMKDAKDAKGAEYIAYSLAQIQSGKVDLQAVSFLLPQDVTNVYPDSGDTNEATVLERHSDWQLVEYRFGNSHSSTSQYRAFKDRIEPVSYRITMHMGLLFGAILLLVPAWIVAALVNAIWNAIAGRKKSSDAA